MEKNVLIKDYALSAFRIVLLILLVCLCSSKAAKANTIEVTELEEYSFANSPLLLNPVAYQNVDHLCIATDAKFMNSCYADAGVDALFVDLPATDTQKLQRVIITKQKINPEGCPDIFQPVVRPFTIVTKAVLPVSKLIFIDHIAKDKLQIIPPPVSIQIGPKPYLDKSEKRTESVAFSLDGLYGEVPIVKEARVASVSVDNLVNYLLEIYLPVLTGKDVGKNFKVWRYETRFSVEGREQSSVTDWILILPKYKGFENRMETKDTHTLLKLKGAKGAVRRVGLINPLSETKLKTGENSFLFLDVFNN